MESSTSKCQGQPASQAAPCPRFGANEAVFELAGGVTMHVQVEADADEMVGASLCLGRWPNGPKLAFFCAPRHRVRIDDYRSPWIGYASVDLAWNELIRFADFFHLDIPQPELPAGQEVPR
ncbi:hypothetical protein ABZR86_02415 [Dyella marensis]|uniref:Uncharacterized protein n=1 Tax=Dyella marensis TaxID=500610 RepID=A0A1I2A127_9GAMM|nr:MULTISPECIES: hypothetical protein [Dyella]SFE37682.1 hypothetical protein SAMN02799615_00888 [Dyella marensis]